MKLKSLMRLLGAAAATIFVMAQSASGQVGTRQSDAAALQNCDGYGDMMRSGDGMTVQGIGIWQPAGDRLRRRPTFRDGVDFCTAAIARLDAQFPQFWMRKVSLLQSRAVHRLLANDVPGALADLDAAVAAAAEPTNPYYLRSLDVNTNFIRAYAMIEAGDQAGGETLAMRTWARRRYSREAISAALSTIGPKGSRENIDTLLRAGAQVDPSRSGLAFVYFFETGRFAEAAALADQLMPPVQINDQTYDLRTQLYQQEHQRALSALFALEIGCRKAYALAALGRSAEARQALADTLQVLHEAMPDPAPLPAEPTNRDRILQAVREQANLEIQSGSQPISTNWSALVEARIAMNEGRVEQGRAAVEALIPHMPATYAMVDAITQGQPTETRDHLAASLPVSRYLLPDHDPRSLFNLLLDAETPTRAAAHVGWADRMFMSRDRAARGGCDERDSDQSDDLQPICYWGTEGTPAVTEERALLRAAEFALHEEAPQFVVASRYDIQHSIVTTMYGQPMSESQAGYESRLNVRAASDPNNCWRCIDSAAVEADLGQFYAAADNRH